MSKEIFITLDDHEKLKKNYFHQDYREDCIYIDGVNRRGIIISDTSWCLYASMHLVGQFKTELVLGQTDLYRLILTGTIPVATDDPYRQPPRGPSITEVNREAAQAGADAIRKYLQEKEGGIFLEEAQMGEIIAKTVERLDDLMDADGYEHLYYKIGEELGW
jgi:hypothetical protein